MSNQFEGASPKTSQTGSSKDLERWTILRENRAGRLTGSHRSGSPALETQQARAAGYIDASLYGKHPSQDVPTESRDFGYREEVALLRSQVDSLTRSSDSLARDNRALAALVRQLMAAMDRIDGELVTIHAKLEVSPKAESTPTRVSEPPVQPHVQPQPRGYDEPLAWMEFDGPPRRGFSSNFYHQQQHQQQAETSGASQLPMVGSTVLVGLEPGLPPYDTMLVSFRKEMSYASYRLDNRHTELTAGEGVYRAKLKKALAGLHPTLEPCTGREPIDLLPFLATVTYGLRTVQATENLALRLLKYLLDGDALQHYRSLSAPGVPTPEPRKQLTWPHVVHAMLQRYLTDDVLQSAYEHVTLASQEAKEDEDTFANRLAKAASDCSHVIEERELIPLFIKGLLPSTRAVVTETVQRLPMHEKGDLTIVRRIASAEGTTYRARNATPRAVSKSTTAKRASATLLVPADENPAMDVTPEYPMPYPGRCCPPG